MFQTEPILWLQSLASPALTQAVVGLSALGFRVVVFGVALVVLLGIDFRRGWILLQLLWCNQWLTGLAKDWFALPRPSDVDHHVCQWENSRTADAPFEGRGAPAFWSPLPAEVIDHYRQLPAHAWGFPSGHTSATATLWGGLAALFRRRALLALAVVMTVAMALARMYLGRHFLADVLGGAGLGLALSLTGPALVQVAGFQPGNARAGRGPQLIFIALPAAIVLTTVDPWVNCQWLGFNLGTCLLPRWPDRDDAPLRHRAARVALGVALYGLLTVALVQAQPWLAASAWRRSLAEVLAAALAIWLTVVLAIRWGWFLPPAPKAPPQVDA